MTNKKGPECFKKEIGILIYRFNDRHIEPHENISSVIFSLTPFKQGRQYVNLLHFIKPINHTNDPEEYNN